MVRSFNPDNVPHHRNPVPIAAVHHNILMTSAIFGRDLETDQFPADKAEQVRLAFVHLRTVLAAAGATPQDVVKLTLFFADKADRPLANVHWLDMYPDPAARPARHAIEIKLPEGCCIEIEAMAVLGA